MPTESNSNLFRDTLIALRDRYLTLAYTSAQKASHAREQLNGQKLGAGSGCRSGWGCMCIHEGVDGMGKFRPLRMLGEA